MSREPNSPLRPDRPGNAFKPEAMPLPGEPVFQKAVNSAFIGTELEAHLRASRVQSIVLVGITTDHCVSTTTRMAANPGFAATVISDATATFERIGPDGEPTTCWEKSVRAAPPDKRRCILIAVCATFVAVVSFALWSWWPDVNKLTGAAAAQFGRVDVVRLLLDKGADPNLRDFGQESPGETPLSTAVMHGQLEVCRMLLEAGADPNVPTNPMQPGDPGSWTALDWALQTRQLAIVDLLWLHGAVEGRRRASGG
jgi:hypothetical protein